MSLWLRRKDADGRIHYISVEIVGLYMMFILGAVVLISIVIALLHG